MGRIIAALLLTVGTLAGCETRPTNPDATPQATEAALAKKGSSSNSGTRTPHTLQFSTDVNSPPIPTVMLYPGAPFSNLASPNTTITLPDQPELAGCGVDTGGSWAPYAGTWTGYLVVTGSSTSSTLNFTAYAADG